MLSLLVKTIPGFEDLASREVEEITRHKTSVLGKGRLLGRAKLEKIVELNYLGRRITRVGLLVDRFRFESLRDIYKRMLSFDWSGWFSKDVTFAIRPLRHGTHDFTSIDVGKWAGQAIVDFFKGRIRVNLKEPDVIVRVEIFDEECYVTIDTTGDVSLHRRGYRVYQHPAPLNPCICNLMLDVLEWEDQDLLDPMCGSATMLIEAGLRALRKPPGFWRKKFKFEKLGPFMDLDVARIYEKWDSKIISPEDLDFELIGIEKFRKHVDGAIKNAESAGVPIKVIEGDATRLEDYLESVEKVATNPPFGLRIASKRVLRDLYEGFASSLKRVLKGEIVVIVGVESLGLWKRAFEDFFLIHERQISYGKLPSHVLLYKLSPPTKVR